MKNSIEAPKHMLPKVTMSRRAAIVIIPAVFLLYGCERSLNKSDNRFVTATQWIADDTGNIFTQKDDHIHFGVKMTLQGTNKAGLNKIDLTVSPYNGSKADTTFSLDGYPIVAFQEVTVENGVVKPKKNPRVTITDLSDDTIRVDFDIPLNNPSDTTTIQPPIPVGQQVPFRVDVHGTENGGNVDQLNIADGIVFTR